MNMFINDFSSASSFTVYREEIPLGVTGNTLSDGFNSTYILINLCKKKKYAVYSSGRFC